MNASARLRIVALLLLPPAVGMTVGAKRTFARLNAPARQSTAGPARWVPFTADVTVTKPHSVTVGHYARASNGSYRLDTGPSVSELPVTYIFNSTEAQVYIHQPTSGWTVHAALNAVPGDYQPTLSLPNRQDIAAYPNRLALRRGQSGALDSADGFTAFQTVTADGSMTLAIPELNFFEAVKRNSMGRDEIYSNIELVEPPAERFHPPTVARVVRRAAPTRKEH